MVITNLCLACLVMTSPSTTPSGQRRAVVDAAPLPRALGLLDALVNRACVQAGPGPTDRDIDYVELVAVCREAETLLYETGWHRE